MKTLVIFGHPNLANSQVSASWLKEFKADGSFTIHVLSENVQSGQFDVAKEQQLLEAHDRILFVYPVRWFGVPPIVALWLEQVFSYGWAYSAEGPVKLMGKELMLAASVSGTEDIYKLSGRNSYPVDEYFKSWHAIANMCGLTFYPPYILYGVYTKQPSDYTAAAHKLIKAAKELLPLSSAIL